MPGTLLQVLLLSLCLAVSSHPVTDKMDQDYDQEIPFTTESTSFPQPIYATESTLFPLPITTDSTPFPLPITTDATPVLTSLDDYPLEADPNCPLHPATNDLPSPLPQEVTDALKSVENHLSTLVNSTILPGIAYSVAYKGTVLKSGGLGVKTKGSAGAPDSNTIFRIGSVSKVFAVLVMYQMLGRGQVNSLDDQLSTYCSGFSMMTEHNITLRQLAAQMSGLPREAPCGVPNQLNLCPVSTAEIIQGLKTQRLVYPPWTRPSYSNLAYALIGNCLVERFYPDRTFEQYVQKYILGPLGMTQTGFTFSRSILSKIATGYRADGSPAPLYDLGWISPAGQMFSSTRDLDIFARFFMSDSSSLQANFVLPWLLRREMQIQTYTNRDRLNGFGTPWEIRFQGNYTILRKGGNVDGFSAIFSFIPELQLSLNILFSGAIDTFNASNEAYHVLIPAIVEALTTVQAPIPYPPDPQTYEGVYSLGIAGLPNVQIITYQNQLVMTGIVNVFLAYREPLNLQIAYPDNLQPCLFRELLAIQGQWAYFAPPVNGKSPSFTIPGFFSYIIFKRIQ